MDKIQVKQLFKFLWNNYYYRLLPFGSYLFKQEAEMRQRERENQRRQLLWDQVRQHNQEVGRRITEKYLADPEGYAKMKGWEE